MEENDPSTTDSTQQVRPARHNKKPRAVAVLLTILVVAVLIILSLLLFHTSTNTSNNNPSTLATVQITANGFEPATLKVKVGTKVTWNNTDSVLHQIDSNPYPANNSLRGLASPGLESGQSYSYTFRQAGKFGYHDQKNPTRILGIVDVGE